MVRRNWKKLLARHLMVRDQRNVSDDRDDSVWCIAKECFINQIRSSKMLRTRMLSIKEMQNWLKYEKKEYTVQDWILLQPHNFYCILFPFSYHSAGFLFQPDLPTGPLCKTNEFLHYTVTYCWYWTTKLGTYITYKYRCRF